MKNATALFVFLFALASGFCVSDRSASTTDQGDPSQAPKEHMPRFYFKEAQNSAFGEVVLGMARDRVRELCGGSPYMEFETIRDGYFAFAVDYYPSGILKVPGPISLVQEIDFFVGKELKCVLVVFYKDLKVERTLSFDFAKKKWERSPNQAPEPTTTTVTPPAGQEARQP